MMTIDKFEGAYAFLSNFSPNEIHYGGIKYPTVEHAYQAAKTLDIELRKEISKLPTPNLAKKAGRRIVLRKNWEQLKVTFMRSFLVLKFQDEFLMKKLKATGDSILIEGNWWGDTFWGICKGAGQNKLGKALMEIRDAS